MICVGVLVTRADQGLTLLGASLHAWEEHPAHQHGEHDEGAETPGDLLEFGEDRVEVALGDFLVGLLLGARGREEDDVHPIARHRDRSGTSAQANLRRMNTTKPISASASVKAMPRNIVVRTMPAASG